MTDLPSLADRVAQAEGPSFVLDREISKAVGWPDDLPPGRYTASLDAAMQLVPERHRRDVTLSISPMSIDMGGKDWRAIVGGHRNMSAARTPALALCAAALRAIHASGAGEG